MPRKVSLPVLSNGKQAEHAGFTHCDVRPEAGHLRHLMPDCTPATIRNAAEPVTEMALSKTRG